MKIRKMLTRVLLILLAVAMIGVIVRAVFNYSAGKKLEKYLERAKAEGRPMTWADLASSCGDGQNGAPLWKAAEALMQTKSEEVQLLSEAVNGFFLERPLEDGSRTKIQRMIEKNRRTLDLMMEAAEKPCFKFGGLNDAMNLDFVKMLIAVRLLGLDAVFQAEAGKTAEAVEQCRRGMLFARRASDDPLLIHLLVSVANMRCLLNCFNRIASGRDIDVGVLSSMIKDLDALVWREKFARSLQGERILIQEDFLEAMKGNWDGLERKYSLKIGGIDRLFYWIVRPLTKIRLIRLQEYMRELERQGRLPYFQTKEFRLTLDRQERPSGLYEKLLGLTLPNISAAMLKEATLESLIHASRIGLSGKIYKKTVGRFPESVSALVPSLLTEEPLDPFTGKPFIYRLQDGGFIVYSFGSNEKDDGGRGSIMTQLVMEKDDDWAWREKPPQAKK